MLIKENFMLQNELAVKLYHEYAQSLPIIDYHCHLDPQVIFENKPFKNITQLWLSTDHYKWRMMRAYGISEEKITGDASDEEKFNAWSSVVPHMFGNPLYHWSHLELKSFFNIDLALSEKTSELIFKQSNKVIESLKPRDILDKFNIETICTTDDVVDVLKFHEDIKKENHLKTNILPTFRPDKGLDIESESFIEWVSKLGKIADIKINQLSDFKKALKNRIDYFDSLGCKLSDHALDMVVFEENDDVSVGHIFNKRLKNQPLTSFEAAQYKTNLMVFFGQAYSERKWVQQYHIGAYRNVNDKMFKKMGPDTGFDAIHDQNIIIPLSKLLNALNNLDALPKTILYTLNPNQYDMIIPLMQTFQDGTIKGKIQFGSAWWFLDNIDGMRRQMRALQSYGLFSNFVGMVTDSRSFLSYPRHDYFRRLLCQVISEEVINGFFPNDIEFLGKLVENISYYNAKEYFNF